MIVEYSSNNSGGRWWLSDDDWKSLESAGWDVKWVKDSEFLKEYGHTGERFMRALAMEATLECETPQEAVLSFIKATGKDVLEEGCNCCGPPHSFRDMDNRFFASGQELAAYVHGPEAPTTYAEAMRKLGYE